MARIDNIEQTNIVNVTASVGAGGVNIKDDVMVVQALLKYGFERVFRDEAFPEPTGAMDEQTAYLIKKFQRYTRRKSKERTAVDGRIDRAVGAKAFGKKIRWAIFMLNIAAMETYLLTPGKKRENFIVAVCERFPQLFSFLDDIPVGTLNLPLESSNEGIGSLNLSLE